MVCLDLLYCWDEDVCVKKHLHFRIWSFLLIYNNVIHHKLIVFADTELEVIVVAPCAEALYQSLHILHESGQAWM